MGKDKGPIVETTSSVHYMSPMGTTLIWMKREVMFQQKKKLDLIVKEGMRELVKVIKNPEPPMGDA